MLNKNTVWQHIISILPFALQLRLSAWLFLLLAGKWLTESESGLACPHTLVLIKRRCLNKVSVIALVRGASTQFKLSVIVISSVVEWEGAKQLVCVCVSYANHTFAPHFLTVFVFIKVLISRSLNTWLKLTPAALVIAPSAETVGSSSFCFWKSTNAILWLLESSAMTFSDIWRLNAFT